MVNIALKQNADSIKISSVVASLLQAGSWTRFVGSHAVVRCDHPVIQGIGKVLVSSGVGRCSCTCLVIVSKKDRVYKA